jgi:hypothetical protein
VQREACDASTANNHSAVGGAHPTPHEGGGASGRVRAIPILGRWPLVAPQPEEWTNHEMSTEQIEGSSMIGVQPADPRNGSRRRRRLLSIGAGLVAASAWAGALGLASGADPYLRHLADQLPLRSPCPWRGGVERGRRCPVQRARHPGLARRPTGGSSSGAVGRVVDWLDSGRGAPPRGVESIGAVVRCDWSGHNRGQLSQAEQGTSQGSTSPPKGGNLRWRESVATS